MNALRPRNDFLSCFFSLNIYQGIAAVVVARKESHVLLLLETRRRFSLTPLVMRLGWACLARDTPTRKTDRLQDSSSSRASFS